jgi:hypothetical protein
MVRTWFILRLGFSSLFLPPPAKPLPPAQHTRGFVLFMCVCVCVCAGELLVIY